jgi:hypothetical protein
VDRGIKQLGVEEVEESVYSEPEADMPYKWDVGRQLA